GFSANKDTPGETLFVAGDDLAAPDTVLGPLATIDPTTFDLSVIGAFDENIGNPELTGTGDARLFGFGPKVPDSHLAEIDKGSSAVLSDELIDLQLASISAWAF